MLRAFWNSRTAMSAMQDKLEVISNNMTNVNTVGYKKVDTEFEDLLQESLDRKGYPVSGGGNKNLQTGSGVKSTELVRNLRQGMLNETNINTDFALDGNGLFKVYLQDGTSAYTRGGNFQINSQGKLVDANGSRVSVVDNNGREISDKITLSRNNFTVDEKGDIYENVNDKSVKKGSMGVYTAVGSEAFKSIGDSMYVPSNNNVRVVRSNDCDVLQNHVELSNVDLSEEMSDMIMTQRAFQLNSSALKTADEMWGMANNLRR